MDDITAMIAKLPDNMPIILDKGGIEYTVSKKEYLQMLKAGEVV